MQALSFEIWCQVVDNLGDAGVCWRLARQLRREHGLPVSLRIDDPATLARIAPGAAPGGCIDGVAIDGWTPGPGTRDRPTVLVSAFGCELPPAVRRRLAPTPLTDGPTPLWVQLEYLSAEAWVDDHHGLTSTKPTDGAIEHYYYPGFTLASGGLLRERSLRRERDALQQPGESFEWLRAAGFDPAPGERRISLFCYPDAPLARWLPLLASDPTPTRLLLPPGVAEEAVAGLLGQTLTVGTSARIGALVLHRYPMLSQDDFDRLLWCCDLNFVRGEDSWVRAQWAGRPFVWQPYPQEAATRRIKLDAFLERFAAANGALDKAVAMMRAWCDAEAAARRLQTAWPAFGAALEQLAPPYRQWGEELAAHPDLASKLVRFCRKRL